MAGNQNAGGQEWEDYDETAAAQEAAKMEEDEKGNSQFLKLGVGRTVVRILPPPKGVASPFMVVYQHYVDLPNGESVQFQCPAKMSTAGGAPAFCPACQRSDKLKRTAVQADRDLGFSISAKRRVYVNVIDRKNENKGPQVLGIGKGIHEELLKIRRDPDAGSNYTHPLQGNDIVIERTGTGKNDTEYAVRMVPKSSPMGNMEWIGDQQNLGDLIRVPSAPEIEAMLRGETKKKGQERQAQQNAPSSTVEDDMKTPATGGWANRGKDPSDSTPF